MVVLGLIDQPVVLGVEDGVDRGEADVLVHAAVAGHVVRVEQFIVVGARRLWTRVDDGVSIGGQRIAEIIERHGRMRDVVQEGVASPERTALADRPVQAECLRQ